MILFSPAYGNVWGIVTRAFLSYWVELIVTCFPKLVAMSCSPIIPEILEIDEPPGILKGVKAGIMKWYTGYVLLIKSPGIDNETYKYTYGRSCIATRNLNNVS